jgi:hypothetical protein
MFSLAYSNAGGTTISLSINVKKITLNYVIQDPAFGYQGPIEGTSYP